MVVALSLSLVGCGKKDIDPSAFLSKTDAASNFEKGRSDNPDFAGVFVKAIRVGDLPSFQYKMDRPAWLNADSKVQVFDEVQMVWKDKQTVLAAKGVSNQSEVQSKAQSLVYEPLDKSAGTHLAASLLGSHRLSKEASVMEQIVFFPPSNPTLERLLNQRTQTSSLQSWSDLQIAQNRTIKPTDGEFFLSGNWKMFLDKDSPCHSKMVKFEKSEGNAVSAKAYWRIRPHRWDGDGFSRILSCPSQQSYVLSVVRLDAQWIAIQTADPAWVFFDTKNGQVSQTVIRLESAHDALIFSGESDLAHFAKADGQFARLSLKDIL
jgi:hypothetical protein